MAEGPSGRELGLVIFDCDGVLVDSERLSNGLLAEMLSAEGLTMALAEARRRYQGLQLGEVRDAAQAALGRALPEDFLERFQRDRAALFRRYLVAVPGAAAAVAAVRGAGLGVCVASQGGLAKTRLSLSLTGLDGLFDPSWLFSAASVPRGKPHPDLFLHAAATMGVAPARCAVVEDSVSGVNAAVSARMRVLGFAGDSDAGALRRAGAEILSSLDALPAALDLMGG